MGFGRAARYRSASGRGARELRQQFRLAAGCRSYTRRIEISSATYSARAPARRCRCDFARPYARPAERTAQRRFVSQPGMRHAREPRRTAERGLARSDRWRDKMGIAAAALLIARDRA